MRIDGQLDVSDYRNDRSYSAQDVIDTLDGRGPSSGGGSTREEQTVTYRTTSVGPSVFYTAVDPLGATITPRTGDGITFANGLYQYVQPVSGVTDFIAMWDEGDVDNFISEWVVVDVLAHGGVSGTQARTEQTATYQTSTISPTVYFTALSPIGAVITARTQIGIQLSSDLYQYEQSVVGITDFIAVWDEGDVDDFIPEWIVVDT